MMNLRQTAWQSITMLPSLIGASLCVVCLVAMSGVLAAPMILGLLVGVLAVVEIGYLAFLILASRRHRPTRPVSDR